MSIDSLINLGLHPWNFKIPVLPNKIKLQGLPVSERVNFGFEDLFSKKINGLATPRRHPEGTPLTAVLLLRLLMVTIP